MKTLGIIALIILLGCVDKKNEALDVKAPKEPSWVPSAEKQKNGLEYIYKHLYMVELEDGTQCVVYTGYRAGGIDCNWAEHEPKNLSHSPMHTQ